MNCWNGTSPPRSRLGDPTRNAAITSARAALNVAALLAVLHLAACATDHHQHSFGSAEEWATIFDDPARDKWQKPAEVIRALALPRNAAVADIGAGTGYFAVRIARALPAGSVIGIDTEPDMVRYLNERAAREKLANLQARLGVAGDPGIPGRVDLVLVVNTYHHIPSRERYFRDLQKSLNPGGRIAIIDYQPDAPMGPPRHARIPAERLKKELSAAGLELAQEHKFLPYQYFLVFRPQQR
jgi:SAM-dependent methyltransferase